MSARRAVAALLLTIAIAPVTVRAQSQTLLAVFAHPDDELLVAPLLSTYARRGVRVVLAIVTDGEKGVTPHAGIPGGPKLAAVRAEEARCSCRALGIEAPMLLGFKDGELGQIASPPWKPLSEARDAIAKVFADVRPDAAITFGPEGAYGHPDHRLVGALVTDLVQRGATGTPAVLLYPGFPKERLEKMPSMDTPWAPTESRFLTVHVPYDAPDVKAARAALACHKSQFPAEVMDPLMQFMLQLLDGRVHLRPWTGTAAADDVFKVKIP